MGVFTLCIFTGSGYSITGDLANYLFSGTRAVLAKGLGLSVRGYTFTYWVMTDYVFSEVALVYSGVLPAFLLIL
jgi:hypothetical protein